MKTEFEERLGNILTRLENFSKQKEVSSIDAFEEIKTLFADVVLKAIGEYESKSNYSAEHNPVAYWGRVGRNELRKEIKAKLFAELGIKEKYL